jgi:hypothetical protein
VICEHAYRDHKMCCIDNGGPAGKCQKCGFGKTLWSGGLRREFVTASGNLRRGVHPVWLTEMKWSRYQSSKTNSDGEREDLHQDCSGSIVDFLDELEGVYKKYIYHRYILKRTRDSNLQFEHNCVPGMKKDDVDWAENYSMVDARSIQSEYWSTKQTSLFICISKVLLASSWAATTGALDLQSEVTVQIDGTDSFWGTVVTDTGVRQAETYCIEDEHGKRHQVPRKSLRARVWYTVAMVGVTGDRKHDSYATEHFMAQQQQWWLDNFHEPIHSIHIHSDNAGQHFKSGKTLNFLSRLSDDLKLPVTWSFGCPGHGKGPWDGVGGMFKRVLRRDTLDSESSYHCILKTYADVAQHLRKRFCHLGWEKAHDIESTFTVNKVVVHEAGLGVIARPKFDEEFDSVDGIQKSFGYRALRPGVVLQRWFDCWCPACMSVTRPGDTFMDSNYRVAQCCSQKHWMDAASSTEQQYWEHVLPQLRGKCNDPGSPFRWWESSVQRHDLRGNYARRKVAQDAGAKSASELKIGEFVAFQDRENQGHTYPYYIGQTVDSGNGSCITKQCTEREAINGTGFTRGDYVIAVRW